MTVPRINWEWVCLRVCVWANPKTRHFNFNRCKTWVCLIFFPLWTVKCSWREKNGPFYLLFCMKMSVFFFLHAKRAVGLIASCKKKVIKILQCLIPEIQLNLTVNKRETTAHLQHFQFYVNRLITHSPRQKKIRRGQ